MIFKLILYFILFKMLIKAFKWLYNKFFSSTLYLVHIKPFFSSLWLKYKGSKVYPNIHRLVIKFRRFRLKKNDILEIYFGLPGSGKTTVSAYFARKYRRAEYPVWSNEPLSGCFEFNPKTDIAKYNIRDGLILLDECGSWFGCRDFKTNFTQETNNWWVRHRHYQCPVKVFAQDFEMCDKNLRRLAYKLWYCKPGFIKGFITCVPIKMKLDIDETTKQPITSYSFPPFLLRPFMSKHIYGPLVWKDFDSWAGETFKDKQWTVWNFKH